MPHAWEEHWRPVEERPVRASGHAIVRRVISRYDDREGALKVLTHEATKRRERRFRIREEVNALRALSDVRGVPKLYDHNTESSDAAEPLFFVMEWIPGATLLHRVSRASLPLDDALRCTHALLDTLEAMHALPVYHRDLKPDNIILRNDDLGDPVIIDLGLAWADDRTDRNFETEHGQELGNRFLRLPEFAPGGPQRDGRSDVTLVAGLLLFMLTGRAPRQLLNERGEAPHIALAGHLTDAVRTNARWTRLARVFNVAFQTELSLRYQSVAQLRAALNSLLPDEVPDDVLTPTLERLRAHLESANSAARRERQARIAALCAEFDNHLRALLQPAAFALPGGHGFRAPGVYRNGICMQPPGGSDGIVCCFCHEVSIGEIEVSARYFIEGAPQSTRTYYEGPLADIDGLRDAMWENARRMAAFAIEEFLKRTGG